MGRPQQSWGKNSSPWPRAVPSLYQGLSTRFIQKSTKPKSVLFPQKASLKIQGKQADAPQNSHHINKKCKPWFEGVTTPNEKGSSIQTDKIRNPKSLYKDTKCRSLTPVSDWVLQRLLMLTCGQKREGVASSQHKGHECSLCGPNIENGQPVLPFIFLFGHRGYNYCSDWRLQWC